MHNCLFQTSRHLFRKDLLNIIRRHCVLVDCRQSILRRVQILWIQVQICRRCYCRRRCRRRGRYCCRHLLIRRIRAKIAVIGTAGSTTQRRPVRFGVASGVRRVLVRGMLAVPATDPQVLMMMVMVVVMVMAVMMLTRRYRRRRSILIHLVIRLLYPASSR